ncbi:MAG: trypsin-like peptidase domain-containing protein [Krumholzibacteria bacterium]|nr:trypsin-like peptidase domain-containing protein [Candidatus Krumholzibacteria bacterium]
MGANARSGWWVSSVPRSCRRECRRQGGFVHSAGTAAGDPLRASRGNAIVRATERVAPAVVSINVRQQQQVRDPSLEFWERLGLVPHREFFRDVRSMGSGVIVSPDGLIVTNFHVVQGALELVVTLSDGRQYQAVVVDDVERYDLAVLRIAARDLPVAHLADSDDLLIGEWAIAIGSPFGYLLADTQPTVTVGVISAVNRDIKRSEGERTYLGMIQTDAAINPGNSGGPLVNADGEVVGINTFIFSESGGSVGIGFAVPASRVRTVLDEIARYGHYRDISLGFGLGLLSPGAMRYLGLNDPVGLLVAEVEEGGPAWRAGLRRLDVLRELGGQRISSLSLVWRLVYNANVGDRLPFVAERGGRRWTGEIVIEELKRS